MLILHTSDLHLGHTFHAYDRTREQSDCLRQIESIVSERKPDAYIICGDVYHTASPQSYAQEMLMQHLLKVHQIAPSMKIILTAGNHDSNKIEINDPLWNMVGVSIVASIKRDILEGEGGDVYHQELFRRHIHTVEKDGTLVGFIVAIPHCYPGNFPSVKEGLPRADRQKEFMSLLLEEVERRNKDHLPVVVMAHTAVKRPGGENPDAIGQDLDIIGGIDMISVDAFGHGYDYVALGHIHCPQDISDRIRYCGSPLPVSFDEDFRHSVSLVTIDAHGAKPEIEALEIVNAMPIITIPERTCRKRGEVVSLPWEEAMQEFERLDPKLECYVRLNVTDDGTIPVEAKDIAAKIPEKCHLRAKFCLVNRVKKAGVYGDGMMPDVKISTAELSRMTPYSVAELFLKETGREGLDAHILSLLKETIAEVNQTDNQE